ncbi:MAG: tetratricopeptide repeat protein [Magnetococcales bacterium]|nr:tetratricopeptide repeat protein [Magnetococcales bacterium]
MAQMEVQGIFEEVDEQLEAENVARFWIKYHNWIIGGLVALFVGLFAYVGWMDHLKKRDQEVAQRYLTALDSMTLAEAGPGRKELTSLASEYGDHGYALLARFAEARLLAREGKSDEAALMLEEVAAMAQPPLKNLAIMQAAFVIADDPKRALRRLENIPRESVFKPHALELAGVLTAAQGDAQGALVLYKDALTLKPESGLRKRLERRVQRMGG